MRSATIRHLAALSGLTLAVLSSADRVSAAYPCNSVVSPTTCDDPYFRDVCHHEAQCQAGFQGSFSGATATKQYRDLDDEKPIVDAKKKRHIIAGAKILPPGGLTSYAGLEGRAHALAQSSSVTPQASYMRSPSWVSGGVSINSCAEYVYEKYYDYMRFIDAANSCHDDAECIYGMANYKINVLGHFVSATPAIANRTLHGRGSTPIDLPPIPLTDGVVPKNAFYNGAMLLTPSLVSQLAAAFPASATALSQLAARVYGGSNYYRWGLANYNGPAPVQSYENEWAYHSDLHTRTAGVLAPEGAANRRRMGEFEGHLASFFEEAHCHGSQQITNCVHLPELAPTNRLLEMIGGDPWIRSAVLGNEGLRAQALTYALQATPFRIAANGASLVSQPMFLEIGMPVATLPGVGSYILPPGGGSSGGSGGSPTADPSALWAFGTLGGDLEAMWTTTPPVLDTGSGRPALDCDADQAALPAPDPYRRAACVATNDLLREWSRDNPGCLDVGYHGCDWHAGMFTDRFAKTQLFMPERTRDYNECMRWTQSKFGLWGIVPFNAAMNVQAFESYLEERRAEFEAFPVPRVLNEMTGLTDSFGESASDSVELGDADSFGGGYSYDIGWSSTPVGGRVNDQICRLDFAADASFHAWATVLGAPIHLVDAVAHVRANENDGGGATFTRSLKVRDNELLDDADTAININGVISASLLGDSEDTNIFSHTIMLGYGLYVDIDVDAEFSVGATFTTTATVPATGCMTQNGMTAQAMLMPFAKASVIGSVYGGWGGVVEAGVEAELDLIKATVPVTARTEIVPGASPSLKFDLGGEIKLSTLSGHVDLCGCFTVFCGCTEIVSWPGQDLGTMELFTPIHAEAPITGM